MRTSLKIILGILGTIVLGAMGSALWDTVKSYLPNILQILVNISTFGIQQLQNPIYVDVARGNYERASLLAIPFEVFFVVSFMMFYFIKMIKHLRNNQENSFPDQDGSLSGAFSFNAFFENKKKCIFCFAVFSLAAALFLFRCLSVIFAIEEETKLRQLMRIDRPFMTESEFIKIESISAQISNREDYEIIYQELKRKAKDNGISLSSAFDFK